MASGWTKPKLTSEWRLSLQHTHTSDTHLLSPRDVFRLLVVVLAFCCPQLLFLVDVLVASSPCLFVQVLGATLVNLLTLDSGPTSSTGNAGIQSNVICDVREKHLLNRPCSLFIFTSELEQANRNGVGEQTLELLLLEGNICSLNTWKAFTNERPRHLPRPPEGQRGSMTEPNRCVSGEEINHQINVVSLQADDPGGLLHVSGGDDHLRRHPQPGAPVGGLYHCWSSGVNQPRIMLHPCSTCCRFAAAE